MSEEISRLRVAYHEAGHALLAFLFGNEFNGFRVVVYEGSRDGKLGMTEYLRDRTMNLNQDLDFGGRLLVLAHGGCLGERIYCRTKSYDTACVHGSDDEECINRIIRELLLSRQEEVAIRRETLERAETMLNANLDSLHKVAKALYEKPGKKFYYSHISEIINPI